MYNDMSAEKDKEMTESWKADTDRIVAFTGLFSAAVANLVAVSIQDLRPNSQDDSTFYLKNIYQLLADANIPNASIPTTSTVPPPFSPPRYVVWVNSFLFLSLAVSLTCGLLAMLLHQWARRYIKVTQTQFTPHKRARIRAFFAEGVDRSHLAWAVEALPILLHLSLALFFAGLLVLLFNADFTVFGVVAGWVGLCVAIYGCITLFPIFRRDSPYCSPLSSPAWSLLNGTIFATIRVFYSSGILDHIDFATRDRMINMGVLSRRRFVEGMDKTAEAMALEISPDIDARALMWTFDSLDEDHKLERFFAGIPGFCSSTVVPDPFGVFIEPNKWTLSEALIGLMHRTLTSSLVSESVRMSRTLICSKAAHAASLPIKPATCEQVINGWLDGLLDFVEFGQFLRRNNYNDTSTAYYSTCIVAIIIARVKERDDPWSELAMGHLGISASVLQSYVAHGDSALLANYIHILREIIHVHFEHFRSGAAASRWKTLGLVSQFDIQGTLPTLQHDFCDLWNEIVRMARDRRVRPLLILLLKNVRRAYIALHEDTDSAPTAFSASTTDDEHVLFILPSYPLCNVPGHRPRPSSRPRVALLNTAILTTHIHDGSGLATSPASPILHDNPARPPALLSSSPNTASSPAPSPLRVDENPAGVPHPDNGDIPDSSHVAHQTNVDGHRIPATLPDPATTGVTQGSVRTTLSFTPTLQHDADFRTSSDAPDVLSLPSPTASIDNMIPMSTLSSSDRPAARTDLAQSQSESHSFMLTTVPLATSSPASSPVPHSGTTAEGEDG
ncbi:hypothetical protein H4582DRAFT_2051229 [Lactarius indigo]|nr:hypothetical protein H4582DRAFT_2051229 [Lactarius indigo]